MNLCSPCGLDFASVKAFDRHRVGKHAYTFEEGLRLDPPREDGRRCLELHEFAAAGLELDSRGRWRIAADTLRVRAHFAGDASMPLSAAYVRQDGTGDSADTSERAAA